MTLTDNDDDEFREACDALIEKLAVASSGFTADVITTVFARYIATHIALSVQPDYVETALQTLCNSMIADAQATMKTLDVLGKHDLSAFVVRAGRGGN